MTAQASYDVIDNSVVLAYNQSHETILKRLT